MTRGTRTLPECMNLGVRVGQLGSDVHLTRPYGATRAESMLRARMPLHQLGRPTPGAAGMAASGRRSEAVDRLPLPSL